MEYLSKIQKIMFLILGMIIGFSELNAQSFNLYSFDVSKFPTVKGIYYARNPGGVDYSNLSVADFDLYENGVLMNSTLSVDCQKVPYIPPVAISMLFDVSTSMLEVPPGQTQKKVDWVIEGAGMFLDTFKFVPPSCVEFVQFAGDVTGWCDFQIAKDTLSKWVKKYMTSLSPGSTDFAPPYLKSPMGAIPALSSRPKDLRRVAIMLTDGEWAKMHSPSVVDTIVNQCLRNKIQVYVITIMSPMDADLKYICRQTCGKSFQVVTKQGLIDAYNQIVGDIQSQNMCQLVWQAPLSCDTANLVRNVKALFKPMPDSVYTAYNAPKTSIPALSESVSQLVFGKPGIGISTKQLTLTANNTDFTINDATFSKPNQFSIDWKGKTLPITIPKDNSVTIDINYIETPVTASHETFLSIIALPCQPPDISLIAPCGGDFTDTVKYDKVPNLTNKDLTLNCIFKNTTLVPLTGNAQLGGTDQAEFSIVSGGGPFTLPPNQCLKMVIRFNPKTVGPKIADIQYNIPNTCGNPISYLTGTGIINSFPLPTIDWSNRRLKTINDSTFVIKNTSASDAVVNTIDLANATDLNFKIKGKPTLPLTIKTGDSLTLNVEFVPQAEGPLTNSVVLTIKDLAGTVVGDLLGFGTIPKESSADMIFPQEKVGQSSTPQNLVITNPSTTQDLFVKDVVMKGVNFKFGNGAITQNFKVLKNNGVVNIPIIFSPLSVGVKKENVIIISDANPGPLPVQDLLDTILLKGEGIGLDISPMSINFNSISTCETKTDTIFIKNTSSTDININSVNLTDSSNFSYILPTKVVPPQVNGFIIVNFSPQNPGNFSANLMVSTTNGDAIITLNGTGIVYQLKPKLVPLVIGYVEPGEYKIEFDLNIPKINNTPITSLNFNIDYYPKMIALPTINNIVTNLSNWTWDAKSTNNGRIILTGNGVALTTQFDLHASILVNSFFSDKSEDWLIVTPVLAKSLNCLIPASDSLMMVLKVCYTNGSLILGNGTQYVLDDVEPNPVYDKLKISYNLALDGMTSLEIFNSMGTTINKLVNEYQKNGRYEMNVRVDDLSSGIYYYRLESGSFSEIKRFIIVK